MIFNVTEYENIPPIAQAGADSVLTYDSSDTGNGIVYLSGSGSSDPNGDTLSYLWSIDGTNPLGISINNSTSEECSIEGTGLDGSQHTRDITVRLRVTDTLGEYNEDTLTITLNDIGGIGS